MSDSPYNNYHQAMSLAYIAVHDKTPELRVLYASSNIRQVLQFEPSEVVGVPALSFVTTNEASAYCATFGNKNNNNQVLISNTMVHARDGTPVYLRIIHFSCDAIAFNVAMALSNQAETPLPNNFEVAHTESVRRLQGQGADVGVGEGPGMHLRDAIYATRDGGFHACLVLEKQDVVDSASPMGPRVVFASKSFERIVGKDTSDVHGLAFLTLVAPQDVGRAARFLQDVACSPNFLIGHLNFQTDAQSSRQLQVSGYVSVEIVGAGSDDGAILLCRMDGAAAAAEPAYGRRVRMGGDIDDGYMSLEDILTSDPETSNLSDVWYQCQ